MRRRSEKNFFIIFRRRKKMFKLMNEMEKLSVNG